MFAKQWDLRWQAISPTRPGNIAMTTEIVDNAIGDWREKSTATLNHLSYYLGKPMWITNAYRCG